MDQYGTMVQGTNGMNCSQEKTTEGTLFRCAVTQAAAMYVVKKNKTRAKLQVAASTHCRAPSKALEFSCRTRSS